MLYFVSFLIELLLTLNLDCLINSIIQFLLLFNHENPRKIGSDFREKISFTDIVH